MRFTLRRVVKYTTFLIAFILMNVWISYNVNLWSFNNFEDRGKVLPSFPTRGHDSDNGGDVFHLAGDRVLNSNLKSPQNSRIFSEISVARNQRSAKAYYESKDYFNDEPIVNTQVGQKLVADKASKGNNLLKAGSNVNNGIESQTAKRNLISGSKHKGVTTLKDLFISVKTTSKYHNSRIRLIQKTWFSLAKDETYFFTDENDKELNQDLGGHLINTNCTTDHSRLLPMAETKEFFISVVRALSCKMAVEIDFYMASRKRWFCHFDDDVYLNVPRLLELLQQYNHREDWYLGKPSLKHPLEVIDRNNPGLKLAFWFATGGAGFCISRSLALKMAPYAAGGRFMTTAEQIRLPDDCTIGYIIEYLLKQRLTVIDLFHSHLEALWLIKRHQLDKQVTFSYSKYSGRRNILNVDGFDDKEDPTRLKSLHCRLFPDFQGCQGLSTPSEVN